MNAVRKEVCTGFALNDLALARGPLSDMVEFDITVSGHHIDRLRGDGVVVSTATLDPRGTPCPPAAPS